MTDSINNNPTKLVLPDAMCGDSARDFLLLLRQLSDIVGLQHEEIKSLRVQVDLLVKIALLQNKET